MHRVFISYHHANDQAYKDTLVKFGKEYNIFEDYSVDTGDISDDLTTEQIRETIRDEYLRDSTVTILLVGTETKHRKYVDWELYSSMYDGKINKKSGIVVVQLPSTDPSHYTCAHSGEKEKIYPEEKNWTTVTERVEYERRYPYLPDRIIDNLVNPDCKISVTSWDKLNVGNLSLLIENAYNDRANCKYNLSRPMRKRNG